jgi:hypothetical protein
MFGTIFPRRVTNSITRYGTHRERQAGDNRTAKGGARARIDFIRWMWGAVDRDCNNYSAMHPAREGIARSFAGAYDV